MSREGRSLRLGLLGTGRMGALVEGVAAERGHQVVLRLAGRDNPDGGALGAESLKDVDVLIDFSVPDAVAANVAGAIRGGTDLVLGTTGWNRQGGAEAAVREQVLEGGIGCLFAPNFSLGMQLFLRVVEEAAKLAALDEELDVWLEERHHRGKADHPSGTALALAERVLANLPGKKEIRTSLPDGPVDPEGLYVHAARGGHVPGEHRVVMDGSRETVELIHTVRSREVFALGAVRAAEWLHGRSGYFTLDDWIRERMNAHSEDPNKEKTP